MTVPVRWKHYLCDDYFDSEYAERGCWCEASQLLFVVPAAEVEELPEVGFLAIGRAGVDGIRFGYRAGQSAVWAYYPIGEEFEPVAASVDELVQKWHADGIKL